MNEDLSPQHSDADISWKAIFDSLFGPFSRAINATATLLFTKRRVAFVVACVLAITGFAAGGWSVTRADRYQRQLEAALSKSTENTPQTLKALEALILADADVDDAVEMRFKANVENAVMSDDLFDILTELHKVLNKATTAPPADLSVSERATTAHDAVITEINKDPDWGFLFLPARLLHADDINFASVAPDRPAAHLKQLLHITGRERPSPGSKPPDEVCQPSSGSGGGVTNDRRDRPFDLALCDDVLLTRQLVAQMHVATGKSIQGPGELAGLESTPQQVYVITENGLNRIVNKIGNDTARYRHQFNSGVVFQARPYYIEAFNRARRLNGGPHPIDYKLHKTMLLGGDTGYFYVSQPYLDLGGNGVVVTLARAFRYGGHSDGAICLDLKINETYVKKKLQAMVTGLGGSSAVSTCTTTEGADSSCRFIEGDHLLFDDVRAKLVGDLEVLKEQVRLPDIAGNIHLVEIKSVESRSVAEASLQSRVISMITQKLSRLISHPNRELRFTIPLLPRELKDQKSTEVTLLIGTLNVGQYLETTAIASAAALFCVGVAVTLVLGSLTTHVKLKELEAQKQAALETAARHESEKLSAAARKEREDLHQALTNVSNVMLAANIPYVRLDSEDYVINANFAFARFVGLEPNQQSIDVTIRHTRFVDWLADRESEATYNRVQKRRREGLPVDPYDLTFRVSNGKTGRAKVVSSIVPASQASTGALPETFGILVV